MDKEIIKDIVEWDLRNWSRAIDFWTESNIFNNDLHGKKVLDIGGRNGGLSLYWALKEAEVDCTDISEGGFEKARMLYRKYGVESQIQYHVLDALNLHNQNKYDITTFKSVLGGIGRNNNYDNQHLAMQNIYRALKPGGFLVFAENLTGTFVHMWLRRNVRHMNSWRYITLDEVFQLTKQYKSINYRTFGLLGGAMPGFMGNITSVVDSRCDMVLPDKWKYIVSVVAQK